VSKESVTENDRFFYGVPTHLTILATRAATSVCENGCRVLIGVFDVGIGRVVKIYEAK